MAPVFFRVFALRSYKLLVLLISEVPVTRVALRLAVLLVCFAAFSARASHDAFSRGFDSIPVKPTPAANSGITLEGADGSDPKSYRFGALLDLNYGTLALKLGEQKLGDIIPFRADLHLSGAYQVHKRIELGLNIPVTVFQVGNFGLLEANGFPDR